MNTSPPSQLENQSDHASLLYPLRLNVVGFKEEDHDYHFRVDLPEPKCCESCGAIEGKLVKFGAYSGERDR